MTPQKLINQFARSVTCLLLCLPLLGTTQSPKAVAHNLKGQTVFLRAMFVENDLTFDAQGSPASPATPGPFSISAIKIDETHLAGATLEIDGRRTVLVNTSATDLPQPRDIRFVPSTSGVHLTINGDPTHPDALASLLNKIFAVSLDDAMAGKTEEERKAEFFTLGFLHRPDPESPPEIPDPANPGSTIKVYKTSQHGITTPRAIYSVDPEFTDKARKKKISGTRVFGMIVNTEGFPIRIHLVRSSLDPGLDENAIAAVSQYRFSPAMLDGRPVAVELPIEISFRLY